MTTAAPGVPTASQPIAGRTTAQAVFDGHPPSALILLHFQNEVIDHRGVIGRAGLADVADRAHVVAAAQGAHDAARASVTPTYHVVFEAPDRTCQSTALALRRGAAEGFAPGSWGSRVVDGLVLPEDTVLSHDTMSAFAGTALLDRLRGRGISRVVLAGVSTHLVVTATAFAAADLGLTVCVLSDACIAPSEQAHAAALRQLSAVGELVGASVGA